MTEALRKGLEIYREKVASGEIDATVRKSLKERFDESPTRKNAINLFCQHCMGGEDNPTWRSDVRNCASGTCPLHTFR